MSNAYLTPNPQTAVSAPDLGILGDSPDLSSVEDGDVLPYVNSDTVPMPFAIMVKQGTTDTASLMLSAATDVNKLLGVVTYANDYAIPEQMNDDGTGILPGVVVGVRRKRRVIVAPEAAVAPGAEVHVRWLANGAGKLQVGAFTPTADAAHTLDCTAFAQWRTTTTAAGQLAILEIDMSISNLATADT